MADSIANWFTVRNGGIREPKMRLPVCIVAAAFTAAGAIITAVGFGYNMHWAVPVVGFGVLSVGAQMGASLSMTYALDCHKEVSAKPEPLPCCFARASKKLTCDIALAFR